MLPKTLIVTTEKQYQEALAIRKSVFVVEQKVPAELEVDAYEKSSVHFLCRLGDIAVGTGRMRQKSAVIKFERIATLPEYRGKNLGAALMGIMQKHAEEIYPQLLPYMHAQNSAAGFYSKLGWIQIGKNFSEAGIDHVAMTLANKLENPLILKNLQAANDLPEPLRDYLSARK
jgi:predicted GNAT family N-acyltransferase